MSVLADAPRTKRRQAGFDHVPQRARTHLVGSPRQALSAANEAVLIADSRGELADQAGTASAAIPLADPLTTE